MAYRVFSGPKGTPDISPYTKEHMLFKEFNSVDEAFWWARHLDRSGRVALLIEGDDGTTLNRREISAALGLGQREQTA
jgi:hypothetical protein